MERIRSALFLDFDNIYGGMYQLDRDAAYALADDPGRLLEALATRRLPSGGRRDLLVLRAYLNPAGFIQDSERGNDTDRLYLSRYRPNLTRSGFEVVDCPALTYGQKNAADIRIVIDVLQRLNAKTYYDEFIVASSDADFTPLLQHLRASDRRTTIISTGTTAPAYRNIASVYLDAQDLIELLDSGQTGNGAVIASGPAATADSDVARERVREQVQLAAESHVARSDEPMLLSVLGSRLRDEFGDSIDDKWFGAGSLGAFVRRMSTASDIRAAGHYIWDANRHSAPRVAVPLLALPPRIEQICQITDLPRLGADSWRWTFELLAQYAENHAFNLTECTATTRDRLAEVGHQVGRGAIGIITRGAMLGGTRLDSQQAPGPDKIREAVIRTTVARAQVSSLNLTTEDENELRDWLSGTDPESEID